MAWATYSQGSILCEFHESRQKTFSSSLRFPWRHSSWAFLDHLGICPVAMTKYVISPFFISRQTSERKGDGLLASWPLLLLLSAVSQHCMYKEWCSGVMRWTAVYRISPALRCYSFCLTAVCVYCVHQHSLFIRVCAFKHNEFIFYKLDGKRQIIGPRGGLCPSRCRLCPDDNSQIRGRRIGTVSLAAAAAFPPSKTRPSSLLFFCPSSPSPYIYPVFPPSLLSLNPPLCSHHFLSLNLPLPCVLCPYRRPISSLSVLLVCSKTVWESISSVFRVADSSLLLCHGLLM